CGWGGGESFIFPEIAKSIAKKRLEEFEESKATLLITACPSCRQMFERANDKIKVKDIINLIAESIS
ncbi:MAG: (Fe-S)-binding protein, partial [Armatimonadetes bacterium CG07_land_8_20_14_0_80_40_9]